MVYKKVCRQCNQEFESESRGQRYCSPACCEKAQGKNKTKRRRRREYAKNQESNKMVSAAYALAHRVAVIYSIPQDQALAKEYVSSLIPGVEIPEGEGRWELHHKNLCPLDNHPSNLVWLPVNLHALLHSKIGKVNIISLLEDPEAPYEAKVSLLEEKLEEALKGRKS